MALDNFAKLSEVIGAFGVILGLIFVGVQLRQNTLQMRRADGNIVMQYSSALRHLLLNNRQTVEVLLSGISNGPLDQVDESRVNAFFSELTYILMATWDPASSGPKNEMVRVFPLFAPALLSPRGRAWWARTRGTFWPQFVADVEALAPVLTEPVPSVPVPQPATSAVAPPTDAG